MGIEEEREYEEREKRKANKYAKIYDEYENFDIDELIDQCVTLESIVFGINNHGNLGKEHSAKFKQDLKDTVDNQFEKGTQYTKEYLAMQCITFQRLIDAEMELRNKR